MKKLLILVLLFSACSVTEDTDKQKWIDSVYDQGWYWASNSGPVPFLSNGSFEASFLPWDKTLPDMPIRRVIYVLDEVNEDSTYAYYRFTYHFNGENLILYYGILHGVLDSTGEPGIFWACVKNITEPSPSDSDSVKKAWLLKTFAKGNFSNHINNTLGLKKSSRTSTIENNTPRDFNAPRSKDNYSGTIKN